MHRTSALVRRLGTLGLALFFAALAPAQVVWNGSGDNDNWSTDANWVVGPAPANNGSATVQFASSPRTNPIVDPLEPSWSIAGLEFNSDADAAFTLDGSALTLGSGGITNNSTNLQTVNNDVILGAPQTWNASSGDITVNGTVSGTGALTTTGTYVVTLSGANTYTGGTTITGGVLSIVDDSSLGGTSGGVAFDGGTLRIGVADVTSARTITLTNSGTVDVTATRNTFTGQITGSGMLQVVATNGGGGSLTLTNSSNSYSGGTLVDGYFGDVTLKAGAENVFGPGSMTVNGNGNKATLDLGNHNQTIPSLTGDGAGVVKLNGASLMTGDDFYNEFPGTITGNGNLIKQGTGTLILSASRNSNFGPNDFVGSVSINAGTLAIYEDSDLGDANNGVTFNGGTLQLYNVVTSGRSIMLAGTGTIDMDGNGSQFDGTITGVGMLHVVDTYGDGSLTLTNSSNDYSGGTLVDGSSSDITLMAGAANVFGKGPMTINGNGSWAVLDLNGYDQSVGPLTGDGNGVISLSFNAVPYTSGNLTINQRGSTTEFAGYITGDGALTVKDTVGNGRLTLSGANNYSGGTTVDGSSGNITLRADSDYAFGSGPVTVNGGTHTAVLDLNGTTQELGSLTGNAGSVVDLSNGANLTIDQRGNNTEFQGQITGSGSLGVWNSNVDVGGVLTLSGANTYSGGTEIDGSSGNITLRAGATNAFGSGPMTVNGNGNTATLDLNTFSQTIASLTVDDSGVVNLNGARLTIGSDGNVRGTISDTSVGHGGSLVKIGTGTFILSGTSTYTGSTTVNGGTLSLDFNSLSTPTDLIDHSSALVLGGGTLSVMGNGWAEIATNQTFASTTLNPGASAISVIALNPNDANLNLGVITRIVAATIDFLLPASDTITTTNVNTNGILGGWATVGQTNWATVSSNNIVALTSYDAIWAPTKNTDVTSDIIGASGPTNSLRFNDGAPRTVIISGTATIESGGILVTPNVGAYASTITGGMLQASSGKDLVVIQNNPSVSGGLGINSIIAGNSGLTKSGDGLLVLARINTYTGGTTINAGVLSISSDNSLGGAGGVTFNGGALQTTGDVTSARTITLNSTGVIDVYGTSSTLSGTITGSGPLIVVNTSGGGRLTLSGSNDYSGGTTVDGSYGGSVTLAAGATNAFGPSPMTVNGRGNMATLDLNGYDQSVGPLTGDGNGVIRLSFNAVPGTSGNLTIDQRGSTTEFAGYITGDGALTVRDTSGNGTLTLSHMDNDYSGGTTVDGSSGNITLTAGTDYVFGSGPVTVNGGSSHTATLDLNGYNQELGSLTGDANGIINLSDDNILSINQGGSTTVFAGKITGSGNVTVRDTIGNGRLTLSGANNYSGGTTVDGWSGSVTLAAGAENVFGTGFMTIKGSGHTATLDLGGFSQTVGSLTGDAGGVVNLKGAQLTTGGDGSDSTFSGTISDTAGGGSLVKTGGGTFTLSGANTYTGATTVNAGRLEVDKYGASAFGTLGSGPTTVNGDNGSGGGQLYFLNNASAGSGIFTTNGGTSDGGITQFNHNSTADHGTFTTNGATVSGASNGGTQFFDSATADHGTFTTNGGTASGASGGWTQFSGSSTAGSSTLIANGGTNGGYGGSIMFSGASTGDTASVEVYGNGNLDISGHNAPGVSIGSIAGTGDVFLGANNLTVGSNSANTVFSGVMRNGGDNGGTYGSLTKTGTGTLTLSGANTYTGGTTISAGTVLANNLSGSAFGTGNILVAAGATLGGSGFIDGFTTIASGGRLAPGNSPGTLTFTNGLTLESGTILDFQLGTVSDLIRVSGGTLTVSGPITLNLTNAGGFTSGTYTLFNFVSGQTNDFDVGEFTLGNKIAGYDYGFALNDSTFQLTATLTAVPEPSTYATLLGLGALGYAAWRRRQKKSVLTV